MSDDLKTQYLEAILVDFYGPAERLQRLAGLSLSEIVERVRDLELDAGIAEMLRPAHRRARALLQLAADRHGEAPADEALVAAVADVKRCMGEMEAWSR
jgi:hypothetical protein